MRRLLLTGAMLGVLLLPEAASAISPARTSVASSCFRSPVQRGHQARVTAHTKADPRCSIKVTYQGGQYKPASLASKRASSTGNVSWAWIVPANTTPGSWRVTVTCQSDGYSIKMSDSMTISR